MKMDTIERTENNFDEKLSCVMTFYRKGGDYFTNHVGQEELVMSNHQVIDTAYVYLKNYHVRRVRIDRVNDTLFSTSIYTKIILEGLTLRLLYDKNYKIKKIQTYTVVKNYSPQSP